MQSKQGVMIGLFLVTVLVMGAPVHAAVITVGSGGDYATIQQGIDAAITAGGDNWIKVRAGTYLESLEVNSTMVSGKLEISGGWGFMFVFRDSDPESTVVLAPTGERVVSIHHGGGEVALYGFTFSGGSSYSGTVGGGVHVYLVNDAQVLLQSCRIINSELNSNATTQSGGGVGVTCHDSSYFEMNDSYISNNGIVTVADGYAYGGGGYLSLSETASARISSSVIESNSLKAVGSSSHVKGGGLYVDIRQAASCEIEDNIVRGNVLSGTGAGSVTGASLALPSSANYASLVARRNMFYNNNDNDGSPGSADQVELYLQGSGSATFTDSVVGWAYGYAGVRTVAYDLSTLQLSNLTISGNARGLSCYTESSGVSLSNTILYGNTYDAPWFSGSATVAVSHNLVGVDPLFVDPANTDYRLQWDSPAVNTGDGAPPGGLGPYDLAGAIRIIDGTVDIGAYEYNLIFADDFESANLSAWSWTQ